MNVKVECTVDQELNPIRSEMTEP